MNMVKNIIYTLSRYIPGKIFTTAAKTPDTEEMITAGWLDKEGKPAIPHFNARAGRCYSVWAATSPTLKDVGGLYCEDCILLRPASAYTESFCGVRDYAANLDEAQKLGV